MLDNNITIKTLKHDNFLKSINLEIDLEIVKKILKTNQIQKKYLIKLLMNKNFININYVKNLDLIWMIFRRIFIIKFSPWINIVRFHPQIIKEYDNNFQYENKNYKNFNYKRILNYVFENPKINFIKNKKKKLTY